MSIDIATPLLDAINKIVDSKLQKAEFTRMITGIVVGLVDSESNIYNISCDNGETITQAISVSTNVPNILYKKGDKVQVAQYNGVNNTNSLLFILGKTTTASNNSKEDFTIKITNVEPILVYNNENVLTTGYPGTVTLNAFIYKNNDPFTSSTCKYFWYKKSSKEEFEEDVNKNFIYYLLRKDNTFERVYEGKTFTDTDILYKLIEGGNSYLIWREENDQPITEYYGNENSSYTILTKYLNEYNNQFICSVSYNDWSIVSNSIVVQNLYYKPSPLIRLIPSQNPAIEPKDIEVTANITETAGFNGESKYTYKWKRGYDNKPLEKVEVDGDKNILIIPYANKDKEKLEGYKNKYNIIVECTVEAEGVSASQTITIFNNVDAKYKSQYAYYFSKGAASPDDKPKADLSTPLPSSIEENTWYLEKGSITDVSGYNNYFIFASERQIPDSDIYDVSPTAWGEVFCYMAHGSTGAAATQINTFNQLTRNGAEKGIYYVDGKDENKLYINADYINTGTLRVGDTNSEKFYASINSKAVKIGGFTVGDDNLKWELFPNDYSKGYVYLGQQGLQLGSNFSIDQLGNVNWNADNSPIRQIYCENNTASLPTNKEAYNKLPDGSNTAWHKIKSNNDKYYAQSSDGGATWAGPFLIEGQTGNGIKNIENSYLATTSSSPEPSADSEWKLTIEDTGYSANTPYLWLKQTINYTNTNKNPDVKIILSGVWGKSGEDGAPGSQGEPGKDGTGIDETIVKYLCLGENDLPPTSENINWQKISEAEARRKLSSDTPVLWKWIRFHLTDGNDVDSIFILDRLKQNTFLKYADLTCKEKKLNSELEPYTTEDKKPDGELYLTDNPTPTTGWLGTYVGYAATAPTASNQYKWCYYLVELNRENFMEKVIIGEKDAEGNYIDGIYVETGLGGKNYIGINASAINTGALNIDGKFCANVGKKEIQIGGFTVDQTFLQWYQDQENLDKSKGYVYLGQEGLKLGKDFAIDQNGNIIWNNKILPPSNDNLIRNGFGENLTLEPFTQGNFIKTSIDSINSPPSGCYGYFSNSPWSEMIYYDSNKNYNLSFWCKLDPQLNDRLNNGEIFEEYFAVIPYDIDKLRIEKNMTATIDDNIYTLSADLTNGQSVVFFEDLSNWKKWDGVSNDYKYAHYIGCFNYKDSTGYLYPVGTYTRYSISIKTSTGNWADNVNITDKKIILPTPYSGPTIPKGTKVKQMTDGNTYIYYGQVGTINNTEWKYYQKIINKNDEERLLVTKYIQLGLINFTGVLAGLSLTQSSVRNDEYDGIYVEKINGVNQISINASAIKTGVLEVSKTLTNDEGVSTNIVLFKADTMKKDDLTYAPIQIGNFEILDGTLNCKDNTYNFSMGTRGIYLGDYFKFSLDGKEAKIKNIDFSNKNLVINNRIQIGDNFIQFDPDGLIGSVIQAKGDKNDLYIWSEASATIMGNWLNDKIQTTAWFNYIGDVIPAEYDSITFTCYAQKKPRVTTNKNADRDYNITITYTEWDWWQTKNHTLTNCLVLKKGTNSVEATSNIVTYGASAYSFAFIIDGGTDHKITINPITPFPDNPNQSYQLQIGWNGYKYLYGSSTLQWKTKDAIYNTVPAIIIEGNLIPSDNTNYSLGYLIKDKNNFYSTKYFWKKAYISEVINKVPSTSNSDRSLKKDIEILSDNYNLLYDDLKPVRYKFIQNESDRYHTGFISQDVEESLKKAGLTTKEFAGFVKYKPDSDETYGYGLRYEEFIALNTDQIQKLKKRVATLEQQVKLLEDKKGEN